MLNVPARSGRKVLACLGENHLTLARVAVELTPFELPYPASFHVQVCLTFYHVLWCPTTSYRVLSYPSLSTPAPELHRRYASTGLKKKPLVMRCGVRLK